MEPIIATAIVAALADLSKDVIKDSYSALKSALQRKFGDKSELVDAVNKLEKRPDSEARRAFVSEEIENSEAESAPEIRKLAEAILSQLNPEKKETSKYTTNISGDMKGQIGDNYGGNSQWDIR